MIELKIKKKYFDAILELKKPFELRHKPIEKGTIVKLIEVGYRDFELDIINKYKKHDVNKNNLIAIYKELGQNVEWIKGNTPTGRYIIFESGECLKLENNGSIINTPKDYWFDKERAYKTIIYEDIIYDWYDNFCWDYINEKQTYLIEIAKIIKVKGN